MEARYFLPAFLAVAVLVGCTGAKVTYSAMGEDAPAFGDSEDNTVASFIEGRWALEGNVEGQVERPPHWNFSADGTFYYSAADSDDRIKGTWRESGDGVSLTYETFNDEPLWDARARFQKEAESGRSGAIANEIAMEWFFDALIPMNYFELSKDGKKLEIKDPSTPDDGLFSALLTTVLVRLQEHKE